MNPQIEMKLRRIEKLSSVLRTVCTVLIVITFITGIAGTLALLVGGSVKISYFGGHIAVADLTFAGRAFAVGLLLASTAVFVTSLHHLRCLLGNYARREIFTASSARHIRLFGYCCLWWGLLEFVWQLVPFLTLTHQRMDITLRGDSLVLGAVIIVISWCTEMGAALREESELTI